MFAGNKEFVIALDEGTTNAKAIALDGFGNVVAKFSQPLAIQTPREGWVEQSGEALISASLDVVPGHQPRGGRKCSGSGYQ